MASSFFEKDLGCFLHVRALRENTGVEVDPIALFFGERGVGGNLHRRNRRADRRSAPRGEEHHLRPAAISAVIAQRSLPGPCTRFSPFGHGLAIAEHIAHLGRAALLGAAEGFVFQRGDAARLVAGEGFS